MMTTRTLPTLIALTCLFACLGCRKSATVTQTSSPTNASSTTDAARTVEGGNTPVPITKHFKGSIGSSLDLQMKLVRTADQLNGSYYYQKVGTKIDLRGSVDKDGNITLEEFDPAGKQTGIFKGLWQLKADDGLIIISGNWSKPPGEKGAEKKTAFSLHEEPIAFSGDADIATKQIKESNKKLRYEVDARYPQLTGGTNPNFEKFNQAVRASVTKTVGDFKKEMASPDEQDTGGVETAGSDISISYTVALAQDDLISIELSVGSYYQGAAHPNSYTEVINYDLKNGKQLKLSDLFKPGARYLQAISAYCISDLKKQSKAAEGMLDDSSIASGAGPDPKNYQSWTITKKGLGIHFDPYQVGPYAAGPQFVSVPYATLKDLVNPDGPIAQFAK